MDNRNEFERLGPFEAVVFDLDGTLIDSEDRTGLAIGEVLKERGCPVEEAGTLSRFKGITWPEISRQLKASCSGLSGDGLAAELQAAFHQSLLADPAPWVPGARAALLAALGTCPTAVVTSSHRESLEEALTPIPRTLALMTVCSEDFARSKPAPDAYIRAASLLAVPPERCLAFEDSPAGITAASVAGMTVVGISRDMTEEVRRSLEPITGAMIPDFRSLPAGFFSAETEQL